MSSGKNGNNEELFILHSRATVRTATGVEEETSDESSSRLSDHFAKYQGSGSTDDEKNFVSALPTK